MQPIVYGFSGPELTPDERSFFADADPAGYILFGRNCVDRRQLKALTDELRALSGRDDLPILIDQEGGRVQRMREPEWPRLPAPGLFAGLYRRAPMTAIRAAELNAGAIAAMLREVGVNVDCLPLLDVPQPYTDEVIGDRALGTEPIQVAALGRAVLDGLETGGVLGVVKHLPGYGHTRVDPHHALPVADVPEPALAMDLEPFIKLNRAPAGMTAHIVYPAWDAGHCATQSPTVIEKIVRGRIGFSGLLLTDDIVMEALSGSHAERAASVIAAGCDIALHCSGRLDEMIEASGALGEITPRSRERLDRALASIAGKAPAASFAELAAERDALIAGTEAGDNPVGAA
ncbi:MAG: glycoside hydrolase family 3 N-terminal domain-containing protein [Sphingomonadaceae bacterium]